MRLLYSKTSPFARKVRATIIALDLDARVELQEATFLDPTPEFLSANPLCRIPTLIADDGTVLFDSPVICEYLDAIAEGFPLIPSAAAARWACRRAEALADGMMDNTVARTQMRGSGVPADNALIRRHEAAIGRCVDRLEQEPPADRIDLGTIALCCALGFLDLRYPELDWRAGRPRLADWFRRMEAGHRCIRDTAPPG